MAGSENYISNPYYPWGNVQGNGKFAETTITMHPSCNGMSATLAPSVFESSADTLLATTPPSNNNNTMPPSGLEFNFSQESKVFDSYSRDGSTQGLSSGQVTPAEVFGDSFIQDGGWSEEVATA
jgi:hypothetical protein